MRSKDTFRTQVLKSLLSDITYAEKSIPTTASAKQLTPSFYISILRTSISKREESIRLFKEANRTELVEKEQKEADILAKYLPTQMADEEVEQVVRGVMKELGVEKGHGKKEMGKVMRECAKLLDETRVSKKKVADIMGKLLM
ncbi:Yqey-like protein-domain-containing protein [Paraphysoderma sedebokerense]|nr:Yqey-like protein-domain-containing protein [Paraphysoderma sedebokerense]